MKLIKILGQNFHFLEVFSLLIPIFISLAVLVAGCGFSATFATLFGVSAGWVLLFVIVRSTAAADRVYYWNK